MSLDDSLKRLGRRRPKTWRPEPEVLLCPNVPQPMHGVAPRVVLGRRWWDQTRRAAYASTSYHCLACEVHKSAARGPRWLEGHELYDIDYGRGRMVYRRTVPLCSYCHNFIHDGRLSALAEKGQIPRSKLVAVLQHGNRVLREAGLTRPTHEERERLITNMYLEGLIAEWKDWRLVLRGKEYPPKFKSPEQLRRAFR